MVLHRQLLLVVGPPLARKLRPLPVGRALALLRRLGVWLVAFKLLHAQFLPGVVGACARA